MFRIKLPSRAKIFRLLQLEHQQVGDIHVIPDVSPGILHIPWTVNNLKKNIFISKGSRHHGAVVYTYSAPVLNGIGDG